MTLEVKKVGITRDDEVRVGGERTGEYVIVVRIGDHDRSDVCGDDYFGDAAQTFGKQRGGELLFGHLGREPGTRRDFLELCEKPLGGVELDSLGENRLNQAARRAVP